MSSSAEANPHQVLIDQLIRAKDSVEAFSGLGRSTLKTQELQALDRQMVQSGRLAKFLGNTPLVWYQTESNLMSAIKERIEAAGTPVQNIRLSAKNTLDECRRFAWQHQRVFLPGEKPPSGPAVFNRTTGIHSSLDGNTPLREAWRVLDQDAAELQAALNELNLALRTCTKACLKTGRTFAFAVGDFGPELILPTQWANQSVPKALLRYLLKVEIPSLTASETSGPWTRSETQSIELAIQALERVCAQFGQEKKLTKDVATPVFVDLLGISKTAFTKMAWKDSSIDRWHKRGRPQADLVLSETDLCNALER